MTLLQAVLQKLSLKKNTHAQTLPDAATRACPANERHELLHQLQAQRQLLEVVPQGSQRGYQSMIIAIDTTRRLLWLDDLFPPQRMLEVGDQITVRHHRDGELLTITTPIVAWGSDFGASGMAVMLPDQTSYQPRRAQLRYVLGEHMSITGKIRTLGEEPVYGTVEDLSAGGLRILVAGNLLSQIHHGAILPLCEVHLSRELQIRCRARVRAFRICRTPYRSTQISLEFVDLSAARQLQLQQFIEYLTNKDRPRRYAA
jgi:c-di-GMP-binding flagellar brake protein YcgR